MSFHFSDILLDYQAFAVKEVLGGLFASWEVSVSASWEVSVSLWEAEP